MSYDQEFNNESLSVQLGGKETDDFDHEALGDEIHQRAKDQRVPRCCLCCNMLFASISLGFFYIMPVIIFYNGAAALWTLHPFICLIVGKIMIVCCITSSISFYNAYSPEVWICEWISWLQRTLSYTFFCISVPILMLAAMQGLTDWRYKETIEYNFDEALEVLKEGLNKNSCIYLYLDGAERNQNSAGILLFLMGVMPISFAFIGLGISFDFENMAQFVFNLKLVEEYDNLKEYDEALEKADKLALLSDEKHNAELDNTFTTNDSLRVNIPFDQFEEDYYDLSDNF